MKSPKTLRGGVSDLPPSVPSPGPSEFQPGSSPVRAGGKRRNQVLCSCGGGLSHYRPGTHAGLSDRVSAGTASVKANSFQLALSLMSCE